MEKMQFHKVNIEGNYFYTVELNKLTNEEYDRIKPMMEYLGGHWRERYHMFLFKEDMGEKLNTILEAGFETSSEYLWKEKTQFFPTPKSVAMRVVELAEVFEECSVLEPSAGRGNLLDCLPFHCNILAVEPLKENTEYLMRKGYNLCYETFEEFEKYSKVKFDRVIMNPPFAGQRDALHVMSAFEMLKENGILTAVVSENALYYQTEICERFRKFLKDNHAEIKAVPTNAFEESGTTIETVIIKVRKGDNMKNLVKGKTVDEIKAGMKEALDSAGVKKVVLGVSGGKDSTIVGKLMVDILGKENVYGVLMPNGEQSDIEDAYEVVELLGIDYTVVNIKSTYDAIKNSIVMADCPIISENADINISPRIRMIILYAVAQNKGHGWRVIGTTNKSEEYIGWLTKWGDGGCDFEPIIDFTVTEVCHLGILLGLPGHLVYKVPVDGLTIRTDEERFGFTYKELDSYIENHTTGDREKDEKIMRMHSGSEHKRKQIPMYRVN